MPAWIVNYYRGKKSHVTFYPKRKVFGVGSLCKMAPDVKLERTREPFTGKNLPTCQVCRYHLKRLLPAVKGGRS